MERTKLPTTQTPITYDVQDEPIVLSKALLDMLLREENPGDVIALYTFYYYTAKWQKTNQPRATVEYTAKGLSWSTTRVRKVKKQLIDLELIKDITYREKTSGKVCGHYVRINFIWSKNHPQHFAQGGFDDKVENIDPNALSANKGNAFKKIKEKNNLNTPIFLENQQTQSKIIPMDRDQIAIVELGTLVSPKFKDTFYRWLQYKRAKGSPYKHKESTMLAYKNLLKLSNNDPSLAIEVVEQSMANNWAGLFPLKDTSQQTISSKPTNTSGSKQFLKEAKYAYKKTYTTV